MPWNTTSLAGHPLEWYVPAERQRKDCALIYLHGVHLTSLRDQQAFLDELDRWGLAVVCPRTGRCWWTDRPCRDFDPNLTPQQYLLEHVLPWIETSLGVRPPHIGLLGTSMGGQGVLRLSYKFPQRFPVCAAISPAIDYHQRILEGDELLMEMYGDAERARQDTATLHIHPLNWPKYQFFCCDPTDYRWHEGADRLRMKLGSLGIPFECDLETIGGGHGFEYYSKMAGRAIAFLVRGLDG